MKPYVFLLRKYNHEGKLVIHSCWIGDTILPPKVIRHQLPLSQMRDTLEDYNYRLMRLA